MTLLILCATHSIEDTVLASCFAMCNFEQAVNFRSQNVLRSETRTESVGLQCHDTVRCVLGRLWQQPWMHLPGSSALTAASPLPPPFTKSKPPFQELPKATESRWSSNQECATHSSTVRVLQHLVREQKGPVHSQNALLRKVWGCRTNGCDEQQGEQILIVSLGLHRRNCRSRV